MVVMSRIRHATRFLNCSEPAKKSGQNIPKNRCRTTVAERMMETLAELPFYRGSGESRRGVSPPRARRTGREALTSSGSHCPATPLQKPPVGEQPWLSPRNASDPMRCVPPMASQENGFALSTGFLPSPVDLRAELNNAAPSLQLHYRTFITTTSCPAPVPRIGTLVLMGATHLDFSLRIGATGSHVPYKSPVPESRRLHAGCRLGRNQDTPQTRPGVTTSHRFRHRL